MKMMMIMMGRPRNHHHHYCHHHYKTSTFMDFFSVKTLLIVSLVLSLHPGVHGQVRVSTTWNNNNNNNNKLDHHHLPPPPPSTSTHHHLHPLQFPPSAPSSSDPRRPRFTEDVANQTVVIGRNGTLRCSVENLSNFQIAWMKADTQTLLSIASTMISRNYRIRVSHSDNSTWLLHLDFVTLMDRGYYLCQINTIPPISRQGFLEVVVPPNILDEHTSADVEVSEDASATLRCGANGYPAPEIRFKREDGVQIRYASKGLHGAIAESQTKSVGGVKETLGMLSFKGVTRADMGHYLCIANNSVPPSVSKRMVLNVRYREPAVYVNHQMIGVYRGDDVAINCTVTAYPRPVVFWQDANGKMIITGGRYRVIESQVGDSPPRLQTTLFISDVREEDIATYTCNASIDNDKNREKSLSVQLNEILRPSTQASLTINNIRMNGMFNPKLGNPTYEIAALPPSSAPPTSSHQSQGWSVVWCVLIGWWSVQWLAAGSS